MICPLEIGLPVELISLSPHCFTDLPVFSSRDSRDSIANAESQCESMERNLKHYYGLLCLAAKWNLESGQCGRKIWFSFLASANISPLKFQLTRNSRDTFRTKTCIMFHVFMKAQALFQSCIVPIPWCWKIGSSKTFGLLLCQLKARGNFSPTLGNFSSPNENIQICATKINGTSQSSLGLPCST